MITRPTTDQLIEDVCRELLEDVLPALADEPLQVRVVMAETVLRNAAVRAAHEIAWMSEESAALTAFAHIVESRVPDDGLRASLADVEAAPTGPAPRRGRRTLRACRTRVLVGAGRRPAQRRHRPHRTGPVGAA